MRTILKRDRKIPRPPSARAALDRRDAIDLEIARIEAQLQDVMFAARTPTEAYERWKRSALHARKNFKEERRQIDAWLLQGDELLTRARDVFDALILDEVELEPEELELAEKLKRHHGAPAAPEKIFAIRNK